MRPYCDQLCREGNDPVLLTEGGVVMKTGMIVFAIGIATAFLGCATNEVQDDQFLHVRVASYSAPASVWYGAITVNPEQVFED
jgi:hypothetical protein